MTHVIPTSHAWADLTHSDFAALDLTRTIAILPLGATEQHGPHLPLSVDTDLAHGLVAEAARQLPPDFPAFFLPVQPIGFSPEHTAFGGTLSLKAETILRLWTDIAESVYASGVKKLVLFNTHGGNIGLMDPVGRDLRARLDMLIYRVNWFDLPLTAADGSDVRSRFSAAEQRFGVHAGAVETAMMLALRPGQVRNDKLAAFASSSQARARDFPILGNSRSARLCWAAHDLNHAGAAGDATAATAADGLALIHAAGRALAELLQEIDRLPADTVQAAPTGGQSKSD